MRRRGKDAQATRRAPRFGLLVATEVRNRKRRFDTNGSVSQRGTVQDEPYAMLLDIETDPCCPVLPVSMASNATNWSGPRRKHLGRYGEPAESNYAKLAVGSYRPLRSSWAFRGYSRFEAKTLPPCAMDCGICL